MRFFNLSIKKSKIKETKEFNELKRLKKLERYSPGVSSLIKPQINFVDANTLANGYEEIFLKKFYEFKTNKINPVIIDCGANIGLASIYFKETYPNSTLISFEPDPHIFKTLQQNIKDRNYQNIELYNCAIYDRPGTVSFQQEGGFSGRVPYKNDTENIITVDCIDFNDVLFKYDTIDFLKVDIEGAENKILPVISKSLKKIENFFLEYHSHEEKPQKLHDLLGILQKAGFRYHILEAFTREKPFVNRNTLLGMDLQLNIFAYRE